MTVIQDNFIIFEPADETEVGLIFYPGGLVEQTAYALILRMIAEEGVLVVIVPMPFNLAILNPGMAGEVIANHSNISNWTPAGHSLGGASAAIFAGNNTDKLMPLPSRIPTRPTVRIHRILICESFQSMGRRMAFRIRKTLMRNAISYRKALFSLPSMAPTMHNSGIIDRKKETLQRSSARQNSMRP